MMRDLYIVMLCMSTGSVSRWPLGDGRADRVHRCANLPGNVLDRCYYGAMKPASRSPDILPANEREHANAPGEELELMPGELREPEAFEESDRLDESDLRTEANP